MRIAVIGAGGVGGYFGASMARAGHEVKFLARGPHLEAIRSRGMEVREPEGSWKVPAVATSVAAELLPADFAIVAVKSYSVAEVAPAVRQVAEGGGVAVPLLNGVEAFETLAGFGVPRERMLAGLAVISAEKSGPGVITRRSDFRRVVVGERSGGPSERAERIAAAFRDGGTEASASQDIAVDLWRKFLFLTTIAAVCGLSRAPIGAVLQAPLGPELVDRAGREIAAVARARGVALPAGEEDKILPMVRGLQPHLKPSFLLDVERGGPNELDVLSGAVSRYGRESGVATPIHDTAVAALSAAASPA